MNSQQLIKDLLKQEESGQLEFKEIVRKDTIGKTICGFLNNQGGQLVLGVADNRTVKGIKNAENLKKELEQYLVKELVPEAPVMVSIENFGDKQLLLIKVWEGSKQPYIFDGSIYYRRKDRTIQASSKEISALIHKRQETEIHWERQACLGVEFSDLDLEEIQKTIEPARFDSKLSEDTRDPMVFLSHYGLYQNGNFTNASVILFAKNPTRFIPQARVRVALLKGGKTGSEFSDDRLLDGNLFKNRIAILDFFEKHLQLQRKFDIKAWEREDDYEIPMKALREGVMNALVHREYSIPSSAMAVIVYPDKIEISNTGKSPYKQSELKKSHLSRPYNPDIAHMVFLRGFIEKIGRGTIMILDECKKAGLKAPVWDLGQQSVKLTFFSNSRIGGAIDGANDGANDGAIGGAVDGAIDGATKGAKEKLSKLLKAIASHEGNRVPEYITVIGVSERTMERYLQQLKEAGLIEFIGDAAQTGGYYLTKKMKAKLK
ncbi:MAG: RNA-binding domain-containing protein [Saprospiraceae bacterium]